MAWNNPNHLDRYRWAWIRGSSERTVLDGRMFSSSEIQTTDDGSKAVIVQEEAGMQHRAGLFLRVAVADLKEDSIAAVDGLLACEDLVGELPYPDHPDLNYIAKTFETLNDPSTGPSPADLFEKFIEDWEYVRTVCTLYVETREMTGQYDEEGWDAEDKPLRTWNLVKGEERP